MKSEVIASMFTGTSFSACLVRVADRVSLADQPVSCSEEITKGESRTASSAGTCGLGGVATCASSAGATSTQLRERQRALVLNV
jgi:hypothetical protein